MGRAKRTRTKYPGVYKRVIYGRDGGKGRTVYDIKIRNEWQTAVSTNLEAAREERERLVAELHGGGSLRGRRQMLAAFVETEWLPLMEARQRAGRLKPQTLENYRRDWANHIEKALGDRRLRDVGVGDVQRFANRLQDEGKAPLTVLNILKPLSSAFDLAKAHQLVNFNPVSAIEKPTAKQQRDPMPLTVEQVEKLADAATTVDDRNLILTAAYTGLRVSELFGLRWADAELTPGEERLTVAVQFYKGRLVERPKTKSGRRVVLLCLRAAEAVRSQLVESERPNPLELFFPSAKGKHIRDSNWNRREWTDIRAAAGLPDVHFHDLRSFFVSEMRTSELPGALTMMMVGHSDDRTHDGYTYVTPDAEVLIRQAMEARFGAESAGG